MKKRDVKHPKEQNKQVIQQNNDGKAQIFIYHSSK